MGQPARQYEPPPMPEGLAEVSDKSLMRRYRGGNDDAARSLYGRYGDRLQALARAKLAGDLKGRVDAEDIVQSVFRRFFVAARKGSYEVPSGEDLWNLLMVFTINRIRSEQSFHRAARRDVRRTGPTEEILPL